MALLDKIKEDNLRIRLRIANDVKRTESKIEKLRGEVARLSVKTAIGEKFASRAFTMANQCTLGLVEMSRTLPRVKAQITPVRSQKTSEAIENLLNPGNEDFDEWLRPVLTDSEWTVYQDSKKNISKNGAGNDS